MYKNSHAVIRHDLNAFVEEAASTDKLLFGARILPQLPVDARAGIYPKIEIGNGGELLKKDSTLRGPTGTYNETTRKFTTDTYECLDRGMEERIDDVVVRDYAKFFDVEVLTAKLIMRTMKLDYESRVYGTLQSATNGGLTNGNYLGYAAASVGAGSGWGDAALDQDFPLVLMNAIKELTKRGETPNTLVIGDECWKHIRRGTKLNTFLYGSLGTGLGYKMVTESDIAKQFGLSSVIIASAHIDGAARNAAANLTPLWNNDRMWLGDVRGGEVSAGGAGRTFVWTKDGSGLFTTETYRSEPRRGDMVRVRHHTAEKVVNKNAGLEVSFAAGDAAKNSITWS
tara:strand:+ start:477 stop:1499 length:1023 start_codon:yes stop_codon:yes gene_type:complete